MATSARAVKTILEGVDLKAVVLGVVTFYALGFLWGFLATLLVFLVSDSMESYLASVFAPWTSAMLTLLAFAFTALAGWVAARRAEGQELLQGAALGIALLITGALLALVPLPASIDDAGPPLWLVVISWVLTVPLAMLGAAVERSRRRSAAP